jgi:hypothetical protein
MFFIRFLQVTAGTRDGTGQSYEETREAIYQNKPSNHHQLQFLYLTYFPQLNLVKTAANSTLERVNGRRGGSPNG